MAEGEAQAPVPVKRGPNRTLTVHQPGGLNIAEPPAQIPESVEDLQAAVRKQYLHVLAKPEVVKRFEKLLRGRNDKEARETLAVLLAHVIPPKGEVARGPAKITLISKIARSGDAAASATEIEVK